MLLLMAVNTPEFFLSHRLPLAIAARDSGFDVHIATGFGRGVDILLDHGFAHHLVPLSRSSLNPLVELRTIWSLSRLIWRLKPNVLHLVTIKPVLYGSLIGRFLGLPPTVAAVSGLGTIFTAGSDGAFFLRRFVEALYRVALRRGNMHVIFQNEDDMRQLIDISAVTRQNSSLIKGSGVCLSDYPYIAEPDGSLVVTLASRLIVDKGVREFLLAADVLRSRGVEATFLVAGTVDPGNRTSMTEQEILAWKRAGTVEFLGHVDDVAALFSRSNIVVLPSYREGLPKVLVEAAACGRAVVTTDVPGCRDAILPGQTGLLVPARDPIALADAIQMLLYDREYRMKLGASGRILAESEYGIDRVVDAHLKIYFALAAGGVSA